MFQKLLIANRGEIALRILRACRELGIKTVAVHSTADQEAMHVRLADESVCIGPAPSSQSYLSVSNIIAAAELTDAQAIHPGFGFLSENADFAKVVTEHGMVFVGPSPEHIQVMGDKVAAKKAAIALGLKVVPGSEGEIENLDQARELGRLIGYPLLIKASAGGGGKGMRVCHDEASLESQLSWASSEAKASFGHDGVYIEKFLSHPRHVEFQVVGDAFGHVVCMGERDCSLQRRHQKVWEEAPCVALSAQQRDQMQNVVIQAMTRFGYKSVGTLEFLYENGEFYFIEMNTRIQVEHPVTEMIFGVDLVKTQITIAQGFPLPFKQEELSFKGHAIECRINAEDPKTFAPSPGTIQAYSAPGGPFVRVDSALFSGYRIPPYYDSLISKLIVYGSTRQECLARLDRALHEYAIDGVKTLIPLHLSLCQQPDIQNGQFHIRWLEDFLAEQQKNES
jgi:acetyl-CoA carboxylase biotin carboxylase subunit